MDNAFWERAREIFGQAMDLAPADRGRFLDDACRDAPDVRREVEELLGSLEAAEDFMEAPAANEVAGEIVGQSEKLETGHRLHHYEIVRALGSGGMGEVYLARDTRLDRQVAIKVLPAASSQSPEANERLMREARSAAKLDHPNICTIHEVGDLDGRRFIVMQYIEGESLAQKLRSGDLGFPEKLQIAIQIAEAMAEAHAKDIIHRDIKPANVIITEKGAAKVLDFGLAKNISTHELAGGESATAHLLSTPGAVMGTVPYMSPEQVKGERLDPRTDIFSFGSLLYEMFTGRQPFYCKSNAETIAALLHIDPPVDDLPVEVQPIVVKCLAKHRDARYQASEILAAELKTVEAPSAWQTSSVPKHSDPSEARTVKDLTERQSTPIAVETGATAVPFTRVSRLVAVLAVFAVALAGAGIGYYLLRAQPAAVAPGGRAPITSLAVLPFENTNIETEYLSDGIAESLINSLSNLPNTRVISRETAFSFKQKNETAQQIGKDLNVGAVLTGKFSQTGDVVTIQTELTDLTTNSQLWGKRFNVKMSDLLQVEEQIVSQITDALQVKLDTIQRTQISKQYTANVDAYHEYLKGRYYSLQFTLAGYHKALEHLNRAIEIDPTYALAYAGVADAYTTASDWQLSPREALAKAKAASQKAIDLDGNLAEAWAAHGHARLHEWDPAAIDDLNRAMQLAPNSLTNHLWLGEYYMIWDLDRSVDILTKAAELDPLSPIPLAFLSFDYYMLRQPEKALEFGRKTAELNPYFYTEYSYIARFYAMGGDFESAFAALKKIPPEVVDPLTISTKGMIFAYQGKRGDAEKAIAEMRDMSRARYVSPFEYAMVYNAMGDRDKTFQFLEKAFADRSENVGFIRTMPNFDQLRDDPRYQDMMRRAGLDGKPQPGV